MYTPQDFTCAHASKKIILSIFIMLTYTYIYIGIYYDTSRHFWSAIFDNVFYWYFNAVGRLLFIIIVKKTASVYITSVQKYQFRHVVILLLFFTSRAEEVSGGSKRNNKKTKKQM